VSLVWVKEQHFQKSQREYYLRTISMIARKNQTFLDRLLPFKILTKSSSPPFSWPNDMPLNTFEAVTDAANYG
jgi:hypothetical protein